MESKSVIIIGKGPSIERCTKEFVDSFDVVAICNRPPYEGFQHLISDHADYEFLTSFGSAYKYSEEINEKLEIKETIITGDESEIRNEFSYKDLNPSTGTLAFYHFLKDPEYNHICLAGFDLMVKGSKVYYFDLEHLNTGLTYLLEVGEYDEKLIKLKDSGHNTELTHEYMMECFKNNPKRKFTIISDYPFEPLDNLTIL